MPDKKIPEKLYKYYPFNQLSLEVFINKQLCFSDPRKFNDPFDCQLKCDSNFSESLTSKVYKRLRKKIPELKLEDQLPKLMDELIKETVACCFSLEKENLLMWSHYAESHTGFCIEFIDIKKGIGIDPIKIEYVKDYPELRYNAENHIDLFPPELKDVILQSVLTKSISWEYEKEYRLIDWKKNLIEFSPKMISSVIFGCKMEEAHRKTIINLMKHDNWKHVEFKEAVLIEGEFALRIKDYQP